MLISKGAEVDPTGLCKRTPLHTAAEFGKLRIVQILVVNGASLTVTDDFGQTPYQIAINKNEKEVADYLKEVEEKRRHGHK
ncbi:uncharacterized protein LOC129575535 [Sitodiplosis mosellana]|uniref:uncharacterized protein LOC129575535 n=1 Tax=Sitodiplosis mosellana TaxID=263140 RepID=UPI002443F77E|nr:uncharacterized protein LOC129575535 [Sitodiplosis mosellana]